MNLNARIALTLSAVALIACTPPPTAKEVAQKTGDQVSALIQEAMTAAQVANELKAVDAIVDSYNTGASGSVTRPTVPASNSADATITSARKFVDRIFTEANVESSGGGSVIFLFKGDDLCTDGTTPASKSCIDMVDKIEVRVRGTPQPGDGMDLTVLIGAKKYEAFTLQVRQDSLAIQVDLAQAKNAYETVQAATSGNPTVTSQLTALEGVLELKLLKNGPKDFTLSYSALKDLRLEVLSDGITRSFRTAARTPIYSIRADAPSKRLSFNYDLGSTEYGGVYRDIAPAAPSTKASSCKVTADCTSTSATFTSTCVNLLCTLPPPQQLPSTTPMKLTLGGLTFGLVLADGQQDLAIGHLSLGSAQTSVTYGTTKIFTADLNALSGRSFDLKLQKDPNGGTPLIRVNPEFNLALTFLFDRLRTLEGATVDGWLLDESYVAALTGPTPTIQAVTKTATFAGGMKIVSGNFKLSSNKAGVTPVAATAGQCITSEPMPATGSHAWLGKFKVVACP